MVSPWKHPSSCSNEAWCTRRTAACSCERRFHATIVLTFNLPSRNTQRSLIAQWSLFACVIQRSHILWPCHPRMRWIELIWRFLAALSASPTVRLLYEISVESRMNITKLNGHLWMYPTFSSSNGPVAGRTDSFSCSSLLLRDNICPMEHLEKQKQNSSLLGPRHSYICPSYHPQDWCRTVFIL